MNKHASASPFSPIREVIKQHTDKSLLADSLTLCSSCGEKTACIQWNHTQCCGPCRQELKVKRHVSSSVFKFLSE